jgi:hypothetical protein
MERTRYDLTARRIARLDPLGFFIWLLTAFEQFLRFAGWVDPRSAPPGEEAEVIGDTLARLKELTGDEPPWLFPVEFQTKPDPGMFGRLQRQIGQWWEDLRPDPLPDSRYKVCAAVVNLTGTPESAPASREYRFPTPDSLFWGGKVCERYLAEESADKTLARIESGALRRIILALIPLMQGAGEAGIISRWVAEANRETDVRRRADLGSLALTLATLKDWYPVWKEALKEWNMLESPYVLELQAEARREATREATLKAKREDLKLFLEGRFGSLPADLVQRIETTTELAKLDQLLQAAPRINSLEELPH